ncbi:hypothetical protein B9Z55_028153 [Caenorhabditis nigoni]|uniref:Uncharacterized protein n=1 Tax=Caenorhabditis nigoni TaxID=1611254 RepID=A0A2G5SCI4_9PELO|nr:hypothetical protein B9Z55_028153 [Caenorhabditis nigoni]
MQLLLTTFSSSRRSLDRSKCFGFTLEDPDTVKEIKRLKNKGAVAAHDHAWKERKTRAPLEFFAARHDGLYSAQS